MARPQKHDEKEVLKRAVDLFWRKGCDAVSTRDLEKALDLKAPAIYRRFKNKNALLVRCIDYYVAAVVERRIARVLEGAEDPIAGLRDFFYEMLLPHKDEPGLRGCLLTNTSAYRETNAPDVTSALQRGLCGIQTAFRCQLERAIANDQLPRHADVNALASALFMSLQGLLILARAGQRDLEAGIEATFQLITQMKDQDGKTDPARGWRGSGCI